MTGAQTWSGRRLHFIGIGGCGMSGLALVARRLGAQVTGSDRSDGPFLQRLRDQGIAVTLGHATSAPDGAEVVVSSAVPETNAERVDARNRLLVEMSRGHLLAELVQMRRTIAVAGTHGKTTTAAMIVHALRGAGHTADYVIGGDILPTRTNAQWDDGEWLVVETDESDRSLLELAPDIAVLTNVEYDHVDTFASLGDVEGVFRRFLQQSGYAVLWDRAQLRHLRDGPMSLFDVPSPQLTATGSRFDWRECTVELRLPGAHNALNAGAALEACVAAGADPARAAASMADFSGVARRFELVGQRADGAVVYDDYAHHPTEVVATLAAARTLGPQRLVAVLRPWGATRVRVMAEAFGAALASADLVVVLDIAGGGAAAGSDEVDAGLIVQAARRSAPTRPTAWIPDPDGVVRFLADELGSGSMCVTLGCGDVAARLMQGPAPVEEATGVGDPTAWVGVQP
jgi:UDP-N-acetylmuramate--alanine ligase